MSENKAPAVVATMTVELVLALIPVAARLYTRTFIKRALGWDDALLLLGFLLTLGYTIAMYVTVGLGYGKRFTNFTPQRYADIVKVELIAQTFAVVAFAPTKCAVGATIMRVFPGRILHAVLWFLMITVTVIFFLCAIFDFVQCNPASHMWNPTIPAKCWNPIVYTNYSIFTGAWGAMYDFALAAIPWWYIARLQMKLTERLAIASAMSLGVFAGICAVVKSVVLTNLSSRTDYAYDTVGVILWANTELVLIMIAASIPTLRPLLLKIQGKDDSRYGRSQQFEFQTYSSRKSAGHRVNAERIPSQTDSEEAVLTGAILGRNPSAISNLSRE